MFRVLLPQSKGLTVVVMINTAIIAWNAWFSASIYVTTAQKIMATTIMDQTNCC